LNQIAHSIQPQRCILHNVLTYLKKKKNEGKEEYEKK